MASIDDVPPRYRKRLTIDGNECWIWHGAKNLQGYGVVSVFQGPRAVHRFIFELLVGPVPRDFELHHKCRVPACCNPAHLAVLTRLQHKNLHWKTHCYRGHELTPANTIRGKNGLRQCRQCKEASYRRWAGANARRRQARMKIWRSEHRDQVKATKRIWEDQNREKVRAMKRASYYRNKEKSYGV